MKKFLVGAVVFLMPALALAAAPTGNETLTDSTNGFVNVVDNLTSAANALIPFFLAIAVVVFIYGVIKYILVTGAEEKSAARGYIIYGIIGIAVIISLFGVIKLLQNTLGIQDNASVTIPQFDTNANP
jgi:hypothetical protein